MKIKYYISILAMFLTIAESVSQNFDWNKIYGGNNLDVVHEIANDFSGKGIYVASNVSRSSGHAETTIDTININSNKSGFSVISKFDTSGRVIWSKKIFDGFVLGGQIACDINDNLYYLATLNNFDSARVFSNSPKINNSDFSKNVCVLLKLSKDGNFIWQRIIPKGNGIGIKVLNKYIVLLIVTDNTNSYVIDNDTVIKSRYGFSILDTNNIHQFSRAIVSFNSPAEMNNFGVWDFAMNGKYIHVLGFTSDSLFIDTIQWDYPYKSTSGFMNIKLKFNIETRKCDAIQKITSFPSSKTYFGKSSLNIFDKNRFCLIGHYQDSLEITGIKTIKNKINYGKQTFFIAFFSNDKPTKVATFGKDSVWSCNINGKNFNNGFLYLSGFISSNVNLGGFNTFDYQGKNVYLKVDTLGNILWIIRTGNPVSAYNSTGFAFDNNKGVYFATNFKSKIKFDGKIYSSNDSVYLDYIISKIYDFSISRGNVLKGPYCAGDTIKVPYFLEGKFGIGNEFVAELSDEFGEFNGDQTELGRLKTNKDSTIYGIIPQFDVLTSAKYRIRVTSTKPLVQSYYRYDSLRLLIYSKDTANAGRDTNVCFGSSIKLATSGGSKWLWSPGNMVDDSTSRVTTTKPIRDSILFRIIISDSSGCGNTDTAYKWVYPRHKLKSLNKDTIVCRSITRIPFLPFGGLSKDYQYSWFNNKKELISNDSILAYHDTMISGLWLLLNDGCSLSSDTTFIYVRFYDILKTVVSDSVLCSKIPATIKSIANGGNGTYYYKWFNSDNTLNNQTDSLIIIVVRQK